MSTSAIGASASPVAERRVAEAVLEKQRDEEERPDHPEEQRGHRPDAAAENAGRRNSESLHHRFG